MVLDVHLLRSDAGVLRLKESQRRRFEPESVIDDLIALDKNQKMQQFELEQRKKELNRLEAEIAAFYKTEKDKNAEKEEKHKLLEKANEVKEKIKKEEKVVAKGNEIFMEMFSKVGNIVDDSVCISSNEADNPVVFEWKPENLHILPSNVLHHHQICEMIGAMDSARGAHVAGHRGYYLKGPGVLLNQALIQYGLEFLSEKSYELIQPPFMMNKEIMAETAQLDDFDESLYQVTASPNSKSIENEQDNVKYLIATSEQPISAYHRKEVIEPSKLPIKYAGISTCFRKEAGSYGKDTWGLFRVHQFEKVEQFCLTTPESSSTTMHDMLGISRSFYESLQIPYRVVSIVSGALNKSAVQKFDLEGWFPGEKNYRELVSVSNCTDYQSRSLSIKFGHKTKGEKTKFVHLLNGTLCATQRTMCCILENYSSIDGVRVPDVLQKYVGKAFLPYIKKAPIPTKVLPIGIRNFSTHISSARVTQSNTRRIISFFRKIF